MSPNLAASVRARLTNQAKASQRPFQEVLQHYGLERLLYRLAQSPHGVRFLLKGALLLKAWGAPGSRPTRDIDLLGYAPNDIALMGSMFRDVCQVAVADDGLRFDANTVVGQRIKEDADYQGVRLKFAGFLEKARIPMQIDIGFGDVVQLGTLNSRMKDFFDLWLLCNEFDFTGVELAVAITKTFENRGTDLELEPVALTPAFTTLDDTQKQWAAFLKRSQLKHAPMTLEETREPLRRFLLPVAGAILGEQTFTARWVAPGPWAGTS